MALKRPLGRTVIVFAFAAAVCSVGQAFAGPKQTTLLLIRHADKPAAGDGLSPAGEARAKAYVSYFSRFKFRTETLKPDEIFATADSQKSRRPRITVEPLAHALGLTVNTGFEDKDFASLGSALQTGHDHKTILICWHHGAMPGLLQALGADPAKLLPGGIWPNTTYDWVMLLRYDADGKLQDAERIVEGF